MAEISAIMAVAVAVLLLSAERQLALLAARAARVLILQRLPETHRRLRAAAVAVAVLRAERVAAAARTAAELVLQVRRRRHLAPVAAAVAARVLPLGVRAVPAVAEFVT